MRGFFFARYPSRLTARRTPMIRTLILATALAAAAAPADAVPVVCADLVVLDANIRTLDAGRPRASALAALDGRVVVLGDDAAVRALACDSTRVIDAGGRLVLPGFNDAHVHF